MPAEKTKEEVLCRHCGMKFYVDRVRRCWSCGGPACGFCTSDGPQPLCPECRFGGLAVHLKPMLAQLGSVAPAGDNWAYEYKWDGVRALCYWTGKVMRLESRNLNVITRRYPELTAEAERLGRGKLILDGEIVALDRMGRPSFHLLQQRMHLAAEKAVARQGSVPVFYYVFDVLWRDGAPLLGEPYRRRREVLESLKLSHPHWRVPPSHVGASDGMLAVAREWGLEGLMAKKVDSLYYPGERTGEWLKIKIVQREELVIGGWEPRERNEEEIGSLLVGYYDPSHVSLHFAGRVGTGFSDRTHRQLLDLLRPRVRPESPFEGRSGSAAALYVAPDLVAEVEYRRWPEGGSIQQAAFRGLRDDKAPRDVVLERS